ncbi:(deoxy)nucleoside triphosphate pyrophosphohydrolase [Candidatus Liberibacter americanus]|uniref:8-oxo-dGTP diphosphatase n=1 Tax=Candidatus Liberibacter americanus str. Sao Paulo TaxID=1261131 RepID=U6B7M6_9HYPH|nr:(deoxy)nucleoside triphosphate pyrophosphohydrolase [Candidatus Liberibacter americanus]AHA27722.1 5-methyl-dCTP pyrophosphohydrolase [Candidatus Liberibacter americanus str. Sao Paulo]EMS36428.1 mutator MutT protein [Candidatus Liberibacter americanus PW_SP]
MYSYSNNILLVVACAIFNYDGKVLISNRPSNKSHAGFWEFPGGKIDNGESPEEALVRELLEELSIVVETSALLPITFASHSYENFHLLMPLFACHNFEGSPRGCEGQQVRWVGIDELADYSMLPADLPLIDYLHKHYPAYVYIN